MAKAAVKNLITDVEGLWVGHAQDEKLASGVTAVIFDEPATASVATHGGAPGLRDTAALEPEMTVDRIDAIVLSGGSAYGLDAMGGTQAFLRKQGRGFQVRDIRVPIVPGAILFDLLNGGDKAWGEVPVYWQLGFEAAASAGPQFKLGSAGAGYGATTVNLKGGIGSASTETSAGYRIGALVAVNAVGQATIGDSPHFWAAPYEQNGEFGGLGWPAAWPPEALAMRIKGDALENTTIAIVATDAPLTKSEAKRMAIVAQDGLALALRPAHAAMDGDTVFAVATGRAATRPSLRDQTEIGLLASNCLARAIARAIFEAEPLPFKEALPSWRGKFSHS
ncbi:P1 family peptidase [Methyloferula stellata]|uniref:P1 family peptidase n=1 Tax=Methyloferula stellata TaxID=876270 RepID=UPI0003775B2D|nr:P1 family peptidase [Methyloferula stellata]